MESTTTAAAVKARETALEKMRERDFSGAMKLAVEAQKLCHDLENIDKMIMVCSVHCSAAEGEGKDWYKILDVAAAADEAAVRSRCSRMALGLHPDKNRFPGAAEAFQLIVEAKAVLLDNEKRRVYDSNCRAKALGESRSFGFSRFRNDYQMSGVRPNREFGFARFRDGCENPQVIDLTSTSANPRPNGGGGGEPELDGASKIDGLRVSGFSRFGNDQIFQQQTDQICSEHRPKGSRGRPRGRGRGRGRGSELNEARNIEGLMASRSKENAAISEDAAMEALGCDKVGNLDFGLKNDQIYQQPTEQISNGSRGRGRGRPRGRGRGLKLNEASQIEGLMMSSSSSKGNVVAARKDLGGGDDVRNLDFGISRPNLENDFSISQNGCESKQQADQSQRGRGRGKGRGRGRGRGTSTSTSTGKFDGSMSSSKKNVGGKFLGDEEEENGRGGKRSKNSGSWNESAAAVIEPDSKILEYTDAEFNDFERERSKTWFKAGQIWAVYDLLDAMPRFYALINNVIKVSDDQKLQITWLEPLPNNNDEKEWLYQGLPACFGRFKHGYTDIIQDHAVFSHLVNWKRDAVMRKIYEIHPKKGETWAVFKNWDMSWHRNPQRFRGFEYEVVEILSDCCGELGVSVALLGKIEGFCCVFGRKVGKGVDWEVIKVGDRLRFSHRIPCFSVSVNTPNGVKSFFELDPASLPTNLVGSCRDGP
ncbi:hypothetical protein C2S51_008274 [Perilla frutescens var. frutescens]|nr:hypothetical protein C2S51_008274 [Perilla frutescens var. frutescens]